MLLLLNSLTKSRTRILRLLADAAAASAASATCDAANEEIQAVDEIVVAIERLASVPKPATRTATKAKKSGR